MHKVGRDHPEAREIVFRWKLKNIDTQSCGRAHIEWECGRTKCGCGGDINYPAPTMDELESGIVVIGVLKRSGDRLGKTEDVGYSRIDIAKNYGGVRSGRQPGRYLN